MMNMISNMDAEMASNLPKIVPSTRYQGSKRRILPWIYDNLKDLKFQTVLDGFGGTASVSYLFKLMEKKVLFNDILTSNYQTGIAIVENSSVKLDQSDIEFILHKNGFRYPSFIKRTFRDIYYLDHENRWLDMVSFNIEMLSTRYRRNKLKKKKALAYHALFQACLCKRPFNLFHRKNLYLRTASVDRNFHNKTTWDTDFSTLFVRFAKEISKGVFSNGKDNRAICKDMMKIEDREFDLVYLDPPYTRPDEGHPKDYYSFYHFLEGLVDYSSWPSWINWSVKNKCLLRKRNEWERGALKENFKKIFDRFQESIIVVSYGDPGTPSIKEIENLLRQYKSKVSVVRRPYSYSLNQRNWSGMCETLIIGK